MIMRSIGVYRPKIVESFGEIDSILTNLLRTLVSRSDRTYNQFNDCKLNIVN